MPIPKGTKFFAKKLDSKHYLRIAMFKGKTLEVKKKLYKNKRAITPITIMAWYAVAVVIYIFFTAPFLNLIAQDAVTSGQVVGLEAFFYANFNVLLFLFSLIGLFGMMYFVGGGQG